MSNKKLKPRKNFYLPLKKISISRINLRKLMPPKELMPTRIQTQKEKRLLLED